MAPPAASASRKWDRLTLADRFLAERSGTAFGGSGCPVGTDCSRAAWLVTAPYRQPRSESGSPAPWGTYHVKPNGGLLTACGEPVVDWYVFWDMDVDASDDRACPACVRAMDA